MEQNTIKELQDYQLQELPAKENFENAAPDELPDDRKSVNITYKWRNVPFYLPDGSKQDKLYIDWENETLKIKQRLGEILQKINQLETDESKLSSKIFNFLSRKKQEFNGYKTEIDTLKNVEFSGLKPEELKTKIARINEIHRDVNTSVAGINEENRKARIGERIEELKKEKQQKTDELSAKEKELQEKKLNEKSNPAVKTESEIKKIKEAISKLENQIKQEERTKAEKQKYAEEKTGLPVPELKYLPETGELFNNSGKKYLAIINWEDYPIGKTEAERLGEKLCATPVNSRQT